MKNFRKFLDIKRGFILSFFVMIRHAQRRHFCSFNSRIISPDHLHNMVTVLIYDYFTTDNNQPVEKNDALNLIDIVFTEEEHKPVRKALSVYRKFYQFLRLNLEET